MAISSYKVYLCEVGGTTQAPTYTTLCDIKDFPDLGGAPEMLETTTLSDAMQTFIPGIQQLDALTFTANYEYTKFNTIKTKLATEGHYAVVFGGTVNNSTVTLASGDSYFTFDGTGSIYVNGAGVNEVVEMTITIAPSTVITPNVKA